MELDCRRKVRELRLCDQIMVHRCGEVGHILQVLFGWFLDGDLGIERLLQSLDEGTVAGRENDPAEFFHVVIDLAEVVVMLRNLHQAEPE